MIFASTAALMMFVFGSADAPAAETRTQYAQVTVRQRIIVRVPREVRPVRAAGNFVASQWREGRGPRCVSVGSVAGAALLGPSSVDLVMQDRSRVRAHLARGCGGLDFYRGFYVNPTPDGMICAERDEVRSRMGGQCRIAHFRSLTPVR